MSFLRAPSFLTDRDEIRLQVWVWPHERNRTLRVEAVYADIDPPLAVRSSLMPLEGVQAGRLHEIWWRAGSVPAGEYVLLAVTERGRDVHPLQILSTRY